MRCQVCHKKVRLAQAYHCDCGKTVCLNHRYREAHDCHVDIKQREKERLSKVMVQVEASKLKRI